MSATKAWAATGPTAPLAPFEVVRRELAEDDVGIAINWAGICHSDIHQARGEWGGSSYPMVPGHEIGGLVTAVGAKVTTLKVGDSVGVGCMVDSCRSCKNCALGDENYCFEGSVFTYNGKHKFKHCAEYNDDGGSATQGGYSQYIVVNYRFVLKIPSNLDLAAATPLLCAGITVYSPFKYYGLRPEHKLGVVGLGGLGHMAVKFGKAFGCHTTVISRGTSKKSSAMDLLKADEFLDSTNADAVAAKASSFDFIISTISAPFDINAIVNLLSFNGTLVLVGAPAEPLALGTFPLLFGRRKVGGSIIGGTKETQEMLDFCGQHNIVCEIEKIPASYINEAYERCMAADVKYRFVIDASTF